MSIVPTITLNDGNTIPIVGLGTANTTDFKSGAYREVIERAIEVGYRHFDTAWVYGSHHEVGKGIKNVIQRGEITRDDIFITSKIWNTYHKKKSVKENCKMCLKELDLEYVDLLLMHFPMAWKEGSSPLPQDENGKMLYSETDYLETWEGLEECRENGWTRSIGVSNFNVNQLKRLLENCKIKPAVNQVEMHPYCPENELLNYCKQNEIVITAYAPLGAPYGPQYFTASTESDVVKLIENPVVVEIAKKHAKTPGQICLRWAVQRQIIIVPKTVSKTRMIENLDLFSFELDGEDMRQINDLRCNWRAFSYDQLKDHPDYPY